MYEVYVAAQFEAAHRLIGDFGPATRMHGHTYRMEEIVRGERLKDDGTLYDIGQLRPAVEELAASHNAGTLPAAPAPGNENPAAAGPAHFCGDSPPPPLRGQGLDSLTVRI